jgi:hypothetical protein
LRTISHLSKFYSRNPLQLQMVTRETRFSFRWSLAKPASALDGDAQNDILPKKLYGLSWMLSPARVNDDDQCCGESPTTCTQMRRKMCLFALTNNLLLSSCKRTGNPQKPRKKRTGE